MRQFQPQNDAIILSSIILWRYTDLKEFCHFSSTYFCRSKANLWGFGEDNKKKQYKLHLILYGIRLKMAYQIKQYEPRSEATLRTVAWLVRTVCHKSLVWVAIFPTSSPRFRRFAMGLRLPAYNTVFIIHFLFRFWHLRSLLKNKKLWK
jgi:hypothetical protein